MKPGYPDRPVTPGTSVGRRRRSILSVDLAVALALSLGSFVLYLRTLAPTVLPADSGEFQFASYVLGLVHPTGYPLYLLLGKLFTYLPVGEVAYRVNLMSAFWAALAVGTLYLCCLGVIRRVVGVGRKGPEPSPNTAQVRDGGPHSISHTVQSNERVPSSAPGALTLTLSAPRGHPGGRGDSLSPQTVVMAKQNCVGTRRAPAHGTRRWPDENTLNPLMERLCAVVAAAAFAVSETFWSQAVIAEVYTLNAFFVAVTLLLILGWRSDSSRPRPPSIRSGDSRQLLVLRYLLGVLVRGRQVPARASDPGDEHATGTQDRRLQPVPRPDNPRAIVQDQKLPISTHCTGVDASAGPIKAQTVPTSDKPSSRYPLVFTFIFGLSLTHHRSMLLLIPAYAVYLWLTRRPTWRKDLSAPRWKPAGLYILAFSLPLLLYLYIPLRAPYSTYLKVNLGVGHELSLYSNDLSGFVDMVSGRVFGSKLEADSQATLQGRASYYVHLATRQFGLTGIGLAVLGAAWTLWRRRDVFVLFAGVYLAMVAFGLIYQIGDIFVYFIPAHLIVAMWIGLGLCSLLSPLWHVGDRTPIAAPLASSFWRNGLSIALVALAAAFVGSLVLANYSRVDMSQAYETRERWSQILAEVPAQGAILVSDDRDDMVPLWYVQQVEKSRPDLIGLFPGIVASPDYANVVRLIDSVRPANKPVYLFKEMDGLQVRFDVQPAGSLYKIAGEAAGFGVYRAVQADLGGKIRLQDYGWNPPSPLSPKLPVVHGQDRLEVGLRWKVLSRLEKDYHTFVAVVDEGGTAVAQNDLTPGGVYYPTSRWAGGEVLVDRHQLTMPSGLPSGFYEMRAGMYDPSSMTNLATEQGEGSVVIGRLYLQPEQPVPPKHPIQAVFGRSIRLLGYDIDGSASAVGGSSPPAQAGQPLRLVLHWQSLDAVPIDYTVFVHVADAQGQIVAQSDGMPQSGKAPTSEWPSGETILDARSVALPASLAPDEYSVIVGLYDAKTGQRLPIETGLDSLRLSPIAVVR